MISLDFCSIILLARATLELQLKLVAYQLLEHLLCCPSKHVQKFACAKKCNHAGLFEQQGEDEEARNQDLRLI